MLKFIFSLLFLSALLVSVFSIEACATTPTNHSSPLPTMAETHNQDTVLTEKVQAAMVKTRSLRGQSVSASYHDGVVMLQGSVDTKAQENAAINAAKSVAGVSKVDSQLTIKAMSK